ncbi:MAG: FtsX-like permease family protein [Gammaproteobacteria bacterium]|nr:FtsX-like permease family protein [Gammaproteobacteria bacterium]MDD9894708.1 FtsX-like permease family protein [Gammaproteobacteria bacterium]MDD9957382.1 FtsX-like permease family protein [Gammaproteobacteria bacterium]
MQTASLAFRNLFRNTRRTVLTVMLIGFSLTALITFDGVMRGMITLMVENITGTLTGEAQIHRVGYRENLDVDFYIDNADEIEERLQQDASLRAYAPRVISGAMISSSYNVSAGMVFGVDAELEQGISQVREAVVSGEYLTGDDSELLIGKPLAELLEVGLGDRIVLTLSEANNGELAQALFRVSGIIEFGLRELDESFTFINIAAARQVLAMTDQQTHEYALSFIAPLNMENPNNALLEELNSGGVEALNWLDLNPDISLILQLSSYSSLLIGAILFLLASLGVINSMFMSIYERIYEFGVIKAIGTRPKDIRKLILFEAFFIALLSCVMGIALGLAIGSYTSTNGISFGGELEFSGIAFNNAILSEFHPIQFTQFPIYVVLLTVIAAIYPAAFAARIIPSDALQRSL